MREAKEKVPTLRLVVGSIDIPQLIFINAVIMPEVEAVFKRYEKDLIELAESEEN